MSEYAQISSIFLPFAANVSPFRSPFKMESPRRFGMTKTGIVAPFMPMSKFHLPSFASTANQSDFPGNSAGPKDQTPIKIPHALPSLEQKRKSSEKDRKEQVRQDDDFDSDSEQHDDFRYIRVGDSIHNLRFLNRESLSRMLEHHPKGSFTNLETVLRVNTSRFAQKPLQCQYCSMTFLTAQSKGGHVSKQHPNKSESFRKRKISRSLKMCEASRARYLKSIAE